MAAFQKAIDATDRTTSLSFTDSSQPIQVTVGDLSGVSISVSGTWVGSLSFEGSVSGKSWSAIDVHLLSDNSESASITETGQYGINTNAFSQIKITPTISSGTAVVELLAATSSPLIVLAGAGTNTVDFGTKITDATMPTGGVGNLGWLSAIWKQLTDKLPALSNGKIPVEVGSLNVTVGNASLEIANDAGNPIPISDAGGSITVDGTFWQATQPVSAANLPLPTNAATSVLQTTGNTSLSSIDTKTPSLGQALAAASTPVVLPAAQITALTPPTTVNISPGLAWESTATITRAANVTTYTANDVYGGVFELTNIGASGGFVFLNSLNIIFNITALPSGMGAFAVYLFNATPPSAITDNLPYSLGSGDRASIRTLNGIGLTASLAARGNGGSVVAEALDVNRLFKLATGSTSLWGYLVTLDAFTPSANSETATIRAVSFAP